MKAKTQAKAAVKAQAKVASSDNNMIALLKKQISVMEGKKKPAYEAAAAKKKAVHNIQKALTSKIMRRLDDT